MLGHESGGNQDFPHAVGMGSQIDPLSLQASFFEKVTRRQWWKRETTTGLEVGKLG
jgi:hypothetical protein